MWWASEMKTHLYIVLHIVLVLHIDNDQLNQLIKLM